MLILPRCQFQKTLSIYCLSYVIKEQPNLENLSLQICLFMSFRIVESMNHMECKYNQSLRSIVGRPFSYTGPGTYSWFDRINLISVIGTSDIIKWPRKISFQTNFILEQRLLLLYLTSLEVQKNDISHRNRVDVCNIFCVWLFTHISFQIPIPRLGNRVCTSAILA